MSSMGVRGSHIPSAAGSVDPARAKRPTQQQQQTKKPATATKTSKPKSGKKR